LSTGAYSPDKALAWPDRIEALRRGEQPYPVHVQIILSDLCNLDCPQCFVPGTQVATPNGDRPIEKIKIGDMVIGHDDEPHRVTDISRREYSGPLVLIRLTDGIKLRCTPEHPIYVASPWPSSQFEWKAAKDIKAGDFVRERIESGDWQSRVVVEVIDGTDTSMYHGWVHNLEVDGSHSYIANGIVVHNCAYRLSGYSSNQLFSVQNADGTFNHNPNRMLDPDLVRSIIDDCARMGVRAIQITGGGEPTIHPQARQLIAYAQEKGLDTALVTNGLNLERRIGADVVQRLSWLRISVDAATPGTFATVRPAYRGDVERSKKNFENVIESIRWVVALKKTTGSKIVIGMGFVTQEENWKEMPAFVKLARDLGVDNARISGAFTPKGDAYHAGYREEALALEQEAAALATPTFAVHARFAEKLDDLQARPDYKDCWYQQFTTYIGGDGNLYRCCVQAYNYHGLIGNIAEAGGLKALWDSKIKQFKFGKFDARSCATCQFGDKNRAINQIVRSPEPLGAPVEMVHKSFV
jgi:MoaA/NifB/PqqE/SkfB family radical SAM enzyme